MRLGGGIERNYQNPQEWLQLVKQLGYSAVLFPVDSQASASVIQEYLSVIRENDLVVGEIVLHLMMQNGRKPWTMPRRNWHLQRKSMRTAV